MLKILNVHCKSKFLLKKKSSIENVLFTRPLHSIWCMYAIALLCYLCRSHSIAKEFSAIKKIRYFLKHSNRNCMLRNSKYTVHDTKWNIHMVLSRRFIKRYSLLCLKNMLKHGTSSFRKAWQSRKLKKACSSWKTSSLEERQQLIKKHITTYQQKRGKNTLFSFGFSWSGRKTAQMPDINIDSSLISSSSASYKSILKTLNTSGCEQRKEYIGAHENPSYIYS